MRVNPKRSRKVFGIETRAGETVKNGGMTIVPFATSYQFLLPGGLGGLIYNRPTSVYVSTAGGQEQTYPVQDVTRLAQVAVWGAALAVVFIFSLLLKGNK